MVARVDDETASVKRATAKCCAFKILFQNVLDLFENGNEDIAYKMLWSGKA